jgi:hypothetical protein
MTQTLTFMTSNYDQDYDGTYAPAEARFRIVNHGLIVMAVGGSPVTSLLITDSKQSADAALPRVQDQIPSATVHERVVPSTGERS